MLSLCTDVQPPQVSASPAACVIGILRHVLGIPQSLCPFGSRFDDLVQTSRFGKVQLGAGNPIIPVEHKALRVCLDGTHPKLLYFSQILSP